MTRIDPQALASELLAAHASGQMIPVPPSARDASFDLPAAYAVEAEIIRLRRASGHATVGRKVGYANKAAWRMLKLETLVWAPIYDDTVHATTRSEGSLLLQPRIAPRIEPEIVFKLRHPLGADAVDPAAALRGAEWLALGFEIIDRLFPEGQFQPADFVAALGFHRALLVGDPRRVEPDMIATLAEQLPRFTVRLIKDGQLVEEGGGKNVLRSPALCLGELARAAARQPGAEPLAAGEIISSGSLTASHPVAPGETWTAKIEGIEVQDLTVRCE